jgi:hypothetical protein
VSIIVQQTLRPNSLAPDLFGTEPVVLTSGKKLGEGIELRFADRAQLSCHASQETITDAFGALVPAILLRCTNRRPGEWMGIEIDVSGKVDRAELGLRFCPAERLFPRIYYRHRDELGYFDEPDRAAPEKAGLMQFDVRGWRARLHGMGIVPERLWVALQLPERPWFVAALTSLRRS